MHPNISMYLLKNVACIEAGINYFEIDSVETWTHTPP